MNTSPQLSCDCTECPGALCACGCQQAAAPAACACGPQCACACGPQCRCGEACRCGEGAARAQA